MIGTATQRGETLTRQLLTYSRRQTLTPQVIDLAQRLPVLRELLMRSLRTDIEIKVEVPDTVCAVASTPASSSSPSLIWPSTPRMPCRTAARCRSAPSR